MSPAPDVSTETRIVHQRDAIELSPIPDAFDTWRHASAVPSGFSRDYAQPTWNVQGRWVG